MRISAERRLIVRAFDTHDSYTAYFAGLGSTIFDNCPAHGHYPLTVLRSQFDVEDLGACGNKPSVSIAKFGIDRRWAKYSRCHTRWWVLGKEITLSNQFAIRDDLHP